MASSRKRMLKNKAWNDVTAERQSQVKTYQEQWLWSCEASFVSLSQSAPNPTVSDETCCYSSHDHWKHMSCSDLLEDDHCFCCCWHLLRYLHYHRCKSRILFEGSGCDCFERLPMWQKDKVIKEEEVKVSLLKSYTFVTISYLQWTPSNVGKSPRGFVHSSRWWWRVEWGRGLQFQKCCKKFPAILWVSCNWRTAQSLVRMETTE